MTSFASNKNKANFSDPMGIAAEAARLLSPQAEHNEFAKDLLELAHNVENNMESGGASELEEGARRMFANLPSEILGKVQNAIGLLLQRAENSSLQSLFTTDFWNKLKEEIKKEQDAEFVRADFVFDATIGSGQNAINQNDYSRNYTNDELDAMEWKGDENEIWSLFGKAATRRQHYEALKQTRNDLEKIALENGWSQEKKAYEDKLLKDAMQATINKDYAKAAQFTSQMDPLTKARFDFNLKAQNSDTISVEVENASKTVGTVEQVGAKNLVLNGGGNPQSANVVVLATGGNIRGGGLKDIYNPASSGEVNIQPSIAVVGNGVTPTATTLKPEVKNLDTGFDFG